MPEKFTISDAVSNRAWGDVDKTALRNMLVQGLEEGAEGVREAIREVYAVIRGENIEDAPSQNWVMPHHEVRDDGTVVLNRAGVIAAVGALAGARAEPDLTPQQMASARRHLMRHYRALEMPIPESLSGEVAQVQATISGEMSVNDVPLASWAKIEELKANDPNPMEVVVEVPAGKSRRGWNYKPQALQAIVGEVMNQGLPGFLGHQKADDVENEFPIPVTHWVGAKWDAVANKAYFRGVIDKAAEDLKRWIKGNAVRTVSIFGIPKLQHAAGETEVVDYKPLSIDWTPLGRAGMPTTIVAVGEMDEILGGDKMSWKELVLQLKQMLASGEVTLEQIAGEIGFDIQEVAKVTEMLDKVRDALGVSGEMSIIEAASVAKEALDAKIRAEHEKLINDTISEKVSGEMAQSLVKKMLHVPDNATKEQIAGEIDVLLQDEALKETFSKLHIDKPVAVGGGSENITSLRVKRQII